MNRWFEDIGSTLVEVMVALAVIGILAAPLLGMMVHFANVNSLSKTAFSANWTVNNEYEGLKGLSLSELIQRSFHGLEKVDDFFINVDLAFYEPGYAVGKGNSINLIAKTDIDNNLTCSLVTTDLTDYLHMASPNMIRLNIEQISDPTSEYLAFSMTDDKDNSKGIRLKEINSEIPIVLNVYIQGMTKDQRLELYIQDDSAPMLYINVYERPLQYGSILIKYKDLSYEGNQQFNVIEKDNIQIHTVKTTEAAELLLYAKVSLYKELTANTPEIYREGILKTVR